MAKKMKGSMGRMHEGMTKKEPSSSDKSTDLKMSPSVNEGATRSGTAETPQTLGPRTA